MAPMYGVLASLNMANKRCLSLVGRELQTLNASRMATLSSCYFGRNQENLGLSTNKVFSQAEINKAVTVFSKELHPLLRQECNQNLLRHAYSAAQQMHCREISTSSTRAAAAKKPKAGDTVNMIMKMMLYIFMLCSVLVLYIFGSESMSSIETRKVSTQAMKDASVSRNVIE